MAYKTKYKYNKAQRTAYAKNRKRKSKAYRNRQQKVSILTIKKIAKEACENTPEIKFKIFPSMGIRKPIMGPHTINTVLQCIIEQNDIPIGTGQGQRIGDNLFLKGIRLKMLVDYPQSTYNRQSLPGGTSDRMYGVSDHIKFIIRVVQVRKNDFIDPSPTTSPSQIPHDLWTNQIDLDKQSSTRSRYKNLYKKVITMKGSPVSMDPTADGIQPNKKRTLFIDRYIKINKKIHFINSSVPSVDGQWDRNFYLWVYAFSANDYTPGVSNLWGGSEKYVPHIRHVYTVYYSDS